MIEHDTTVIGLLGKIGRFIFMAVMYIVVGVVGGIAFLFAVLHKPTDRYGHIPTVNENGTPKPIPKKIAPNITDCLPGVVYIPPCR